MNTIDTDKCEGMSVSVNDELVTVKNQQSLKLGNNNTEGKK